MLPKNTFVKFSIPCVDYNLILKNSLHTSILTRAMHEFIFQFKIIIYNYILQYMIEYMKKIKNFKEVYAKHVKKKLCERKMDFLNFNILNKLKPKFVCLLSINT